LILRHIIHNDMQSLRMYSIEDHKVYIRPQFLNSHQNMDNLVDLLDVLNMSSKSHHFNMFHTVRHMKEEEEGFHHFKY